jgi:long-chain acyl-CoA synthetase
MNMEQFGVTRLFDISAHGGENVMFRSVRGGAVRSHSGWDIDRGSDALACVLIRSRLRKGDRVISLIRDSPLWNITECAVLKTGAVHVPLPASVDSEKLRAVLQMVNPRLIVVDSPVNMKRINALMPVMGMRVSVLLVQEDRFFSPPCDDEMHALRTRKNTVTPDDTAVILFTSGSTSQSKGVVLSHRSILTAADEFGGSDVFIGITHSLSVLPMSHSAARKVNYACQLRGITICYASPSRSLLKNIQTFSVQHMAVVPHMLRMLKSDLEDTPDASVPLQKVTCGGAQLHVEMWQWYDNRAIAIYEVYGLTETASLLSYSTDTCRRPGCVGKLASNIETRISRNGELEVRGPTLLKRYLHKDGAILEACDEHGWFRTGDVVSLDADGGLTIIGRSSRSYKSQRGIHIHPEEVERELLFISGVDEGFVINGPLEPLKAVLVVKQHVESTKLKQQVQEYNRRVPEDLQIFQYATIDVASFARLRKWGGIKPDTRSFTELLMNMEFHTP